MPRPTAGPGRYATVYTSVSAFWDLLANLAGPTLASRPNLYSTTLVLTTLTNSGACLYFSALLWSPDLSAVPEGRRVEAHLWGISDCCQLGHDCRSLHQVRVLNEHKHTKWKLTTASGLGHESDAHAQTPTLTLMFS